MTALAMHWPRLVTLLFVVVVSGSFVIYRNADDARQALAASDHAFDIGDLKRSLLEARFAAMSALRHSESMRQSLERLSAIAVGSESAARPKTALLARMSLFCVAQSRAVGVDNNFGSQSDEQLRFLVDKVAPATNSVQGPRLGVSGLTLALASSPRAAAVGLLLAAFATVLFGWDLLAKRFPAKLTIWLVPLLATSVWFVGWFAA